MQAKAIDDWSYEHPERVDVVDRIRSYFSRNPVILPTKSGQMGIKRRMRRRAQRSGKDPSTPSAGYIVPPVLYKYLKAEHAASMISRGEVLIGTLSDFRKQEQHDAARGDAGEGIVTRHQYVAHADEKEIQASPIISKFFGVEGCTNVHLYDADFTYTSEFEDMYVYCLTKTPSRRSLREFGADVCVRINNPTAFFVALMRALYLRGLADEPCLVGACIYTSREIEYDPKVNNHPALYKPPRFAYQDEVRGMFSPRSRPIEPTLVRSLEITKYVNIVGNWGR